MKSLVKLDLEDIVEDPNRLGWLKVIYQHQSVWARPCFLFGEMRFPSVKWIEKYGHWVGVYVEELEHPRKLTELQLVWSGFAFWEGRVPPEIYKSMSLLDLWHVVYPKPKRDGTVLNAVEVKQLANSYNGDDYDDSNIIYFDTQWMILINESERGQLKILHKDGYKIEMEANTGNINIQGNKVNIIPEGRGGEGIVNLGPNANISVVRWENLKNYLKSIESWIKAHTHPSGSGPTGAALTAPTYPNLSENVGCKVVKIPNIG